MRKPGMTSHAVRVDKRTTRAIAAMIRASMRLGGGAWFAPCVNREWCAGVKGYKALWVIAASN